MRSSLYGADHLAKPDRHLGIWELRVRSPIPCRKDPPVRLASGAVVESVSAMRASLLVGCGRRHSDVHLRLKLGGQRATLDLKCERLGSVGRPYLEGDPLTSGP